MNLLMINPKSPLFVLLDLSALPLQRLQPQSAIVQPRQTTDPTTMGFATAQWHLFSRGHHQSGIRATASHLKLFLTNHNIPLDHRHCTHSLELRTFQLLLFLIRSSQYQFHSTCLKWPEVQSMEMTAVAGMVAKIRTAEIIETSWTLIVIKVHFITDIITGTTEATKINPIRTMAINIERAETT